MGWVKEALAEIEQGRTARVRPQGGSMRGRIESGQEVQIAPLGDREVRAGDVVFVRRKGNYLLHLAKEVEDGRVLIGNNLGKINGWIDAGDVLGVAVDETGQPL